MSILKNIEYIKLKGINISDIDRESLCCFIDYALLFNCDFFSQSVVECKATQVPTTVTELDQSSKLWFNYKTDKEAVEQRIKNFIQETEANLNTTRKPQINPNLGMFMISV